MNIHQNLLNIQFLCHCLKWIANYRREILTLQLEIEKLFHFSHIAYAYEVKTGKFFSAACIILLLLTILAYSELTLSSLWHITDSILWTLSSSEQDKAFPCSEQDKAFPCSEQDKVHVSWAYLRDFSIEYLLTYKKRIHFFWKSSTADAGNPIRRCGVRVYDSDHYTISAWMKKEGSMDHFMPHKLLVLMIFGQRPHHGLWPLTSSLLQNDIGK